MPKISLQKLTKSILIVFSWGFFEAIAFAQKGVEFKVSTDKESYLPGALVVLCFSISNKTDGEVRIYANGKWMSKGGLAQQSPQIDSLLMGGQFKTNSKEDVISLSKLEGESYVTEDAPETPVLLLKAHETQNWQKLLPYQFSKFGNFELEISLPTLIAKTDKATMEIANPVGVGVQVVAAPEKQDRWNVESEYIPASKAESKLPSIRWKLSPIGKDYRGPGLEMDEGNCRVVISDGKGRQVADWIYFRQSGMFSGPATGQATWEVPLRQNSFEGTGDGMLPGPGEYKIETFYRCFESKHRTSLFEQLNISPNYTREKDFNFSNTPNRLMDPFGVYSIVSDDIARPLKGEWISGQGSLKVNLSKEDFEVLSK